ncbi:gamma-glutamyl phosphate reductase [Anaeromyxobacter dehalogenans 2CP-1]|uniref:Gamma-glutamyl phosphate reductase n=1 Tax=Anaeromyxobacter dehalogenans (strain ATCC BAA-258 / DSM 21875 / 2CP-1) TaxID=455488 RepID=PROA_ANAD2|nr:glutamate-5-semialdehyde dehydrogenase [Anaeromyxobacter dehalogenans]B8J8Z7.1 RecName: Full=Gamma-glutamyl phosphate reductase; Short=GPR; AltName: Full=Glutamate-5-semialdehyde dehydrogenase; AltName: Full=Glutamyl-gamma-semialdehyde dehydrogenase; Short=GSA dehydrogenase [Anaeromyxobacter dehalogenans 2CP-1]ACL63595.1 gamma-glutamyl phosphate reductase [Anaeromyxobacter dehalogenans 2CP-1]
MRKEKSLGLAAEMRKLAEASREAARALSHADPRRKDAALRAAAEAIGRREKRILSENARDVAAARAAGQNAAYLDRLRLDPKRLAGIGAALHEIAGLRDPVGEVTASWRRPNGLEIRKVRIPLGVVLMVYEARPNVTVDAAALCLKSGNAAILRPGSDALRSSLALAAAFAEGLEKAGLPAASAQVVPTPDREATYELLALDDLIDLAIPRGGPSLIRAVAARSRVPVLKHYQGVCHLYLDASAPPQQAVDLALNGKVQRPGVCNATECLLVHRGAAGKLLPPVGRALADAGVELRCDPTALTILKRAGVAAVPARPDDFGKEFLDKILAVRVVADLDGALDHIARYGSLHTEAIVTRDLASARRFQREVDASAVMVNASTRFNDGGELGLGAEIGISTTKLHAFGPMGLAELTTQKFLVEGEGHVR